jgi:hypothetical protein
MSLPLILALVWLVLANLLAMIPSRDGHRARAAVLIVLGVPLVGWVTWVNGPILGLIILAAGVSVLRWPVLYLLRRIGSVVSGRGRRVRVPPETSVARSDNPTAE